MFLFFSVCFVIWPVAVGSAAVNCNSLTNEDPKDVIALPCIAISSSSQYNLTVTTVDPQKWERFTSQLVNISGVNIVIEKSSIDKLNLQNINNGNGIKRFIVKNNPNLTSIHMNFLDKTNGTTVDELTIAGNPKLSSFKIAAAQFDGALMEIMNNGELKSVDLDIVNLTISQDLGIVDNAKLGNWIVNSSRMSVAGRLTIARNQALTAVHLNNFTHIRVNEIKISENDNLEHVNIGSGPSYQFDRLEITKNIRLGSFGLPALFDTANLTIRGNPNLDFESLHGLRNLNNTAASPKDIQRLGECILSSKIADVCDLVVCKVVEGNLELAENVIQSCNCSHLVEVTRDVNLTNARVEQVTFLAETNVTGSVYSTSCFFPKKLYNLSVNLPKTCPPPAGATTPGPATTNATMNAMLKFMTELSPGGVKLVTYLLQTFIILVAIVAVLGICGCLLVHHFRDRQSDDPYWQA